MGYFVKYQEKKKPLKSNNLEQYTCNKSKIVFLVNYPVREIAQISNLLSMMITSFVFESSPNKGINVLKLGK